MQGRDWTVFLLMLSPWNSDRTRFLIEVGILIFSDQHVGHPERSGIHPPPKDCKPPVLECKPPVGWGSSSSLLPGMTSESRSKWLIEHS